MNKTIIKQSEKSSFLFKYQLYYKRNKINDNTGQEIVRLP